VSPDESFTKDDRILAAVTGPGFVGRDHADVAEVVEVVEAAILPGLVADDFEVGAGGEDTGDDIELAFAIALIQPDGGSGVNGEEGVGLVVGGANRVEVSAIFTVWDDLVEAFELFGQADDASANSDGAGRRGVSRPGACRKGERQRSGDELTTIACHDKKIAEGSLYFNRDLDAPFPAWLERGDGVRRLWYNRRLCN